METCVRTRGNPRVIKVGLFFYTYYNRRITRVLIASVFTELEPKYKNIYILDHAIINQSIYLQHDKAIEERKVGARKF